MSKFFRSLGTLIAIVGGLIGFVLSILVVYDLFGGGGVLVGLFIFPLTFALIPFYTLISYGSWTLLLLNYGSSFTYWLFNRIADGIDEKEQGARNLIATPSSESLQRTEKTFKKNPLVPVMIMIGVFLAIVISSTSNSAAPVATSTRTPRPALTPTRLIPPTKTQRPMTLRACVTNETIRIRKGPGTEYEAIDGMTSGTCMSILGRNQDSTWVYMVSEDDKSGWVAAWLLTIDGKLSSVPVRSTTQTSSLEPADNISLTQVQALSQWLDSQETTSTSTTWINPFSVESTPMPTLLCSQATNQVGEHISCKIERASCDYRPDVDGNPTFCNDRPYPNQSFTLVVFDQDWSDYNGSCILVSGRVYMYGGVPQIEGISRSQVSFCE